MFLQSFSISPEARSSHAPCEAAVRAPRKTTNRSPHPFDKPAAAARKAACLFLPEQTPPTIGTPGRHPALHLLRISEGYIFLKPFFETRSAKCGSRRQEHGIPAFVRNILSAPTGHWPLAQTVYRLPHKNKDCLRQR